MSPIFPGAFLLPFSLKDSQLLSPGKATLCLCPDPLPLPCLQHRYPRAFTCRPSPHTGWSACKWFEVQSRKSLFPRPYDLGALRSDHTIAYLMNFTELFKPPQGLGSIGWWLSPVHGEETEAQGVSYSAEVI